MPAAGVQHNVPAQRACLKYFLWRCYDEGLGKALVVQMHDAHTGLASEREYVSRTLPQGVLRGVADTFLRRDPMGLARAAAIILGLAATTIGYLMGKVFLMPRETARLDVGIPTVAVRKEKLVR